MAALSDYLESGILNHLFRNDVFNKPQTIALALTAGIPLDSDDGSSIQELASGVSRGTNFISTNYARVDLGDPSDESSGGDTVWHTVGLDETTTYEVYSQEEGHAGYFYPLFLNSTSAIEFEGNAGALYGIVTFSNTFPNVTFYYPREDGIFASGVDESAGYTSYEGNGFIKNKNEILFNTALTDWGWISGIAVLDSAEYGEGNLLMYAELQNPRYVYAGDNIKFDSNSLEIGLK